MSSRTPVSRRQALALLLRYGAALGALPGLDRLAAAADISGGGEVRALAAMIRELVPHRGLATDFYLEVAGRVLDGVSASAETRGRLKRGLGRLDQLAGQGGMAGAAAPARQAAVAALEEDPFFMLVWTAAVEAIYRDPRTWEVVGYGGNALAKGGYLRDFNDIDWLPGEPS